jgi:D-alanine-D-alanine ligase
MSPSSLIFKQTAEIGLNVTDSITYFIRQSIRERMKAGKNYHAFRNLLAQLDQAIKSTLAEKASREPLILEITGETPEAFEQSFQDTKAKLIELASQGNIAYRVCTPMEMEEGEVAVPLHVAHLTKDSSKELLDSLHSGVHPLIAHTRQTAKDITAFYTNV